MDPFSPQEPSPAPDPEVRRRRSFETFVNRLRLLGATDDEITDTRLAFEDPSTEWEQPIEVLAGLTDARLAAMLSEIRREYHEGTTTVEDDEAAALAKRDTVARAEVEGVLDYTVPEVVEWVGDDPRLAALVIEHESKREKPRTTLLSAMEHVVGG